MNLLLSNKKPLRTKENRFFDTFESLCTSADSIFISTGYISIDSILYLHKNIENGAISNLDLIIGMHNFDGFSRPQYEASIDLARYLRESGKGCISISIAFPYHGKVYCFQKEGQAVAAILGSSNLTSVGQKDSLNYEVNIALQEFKLTSKLLEFHSQLKEKACKPLEEWKPKPFIDSSQIPGAERLNGRQIADAWRRRTEYEFRLPLKDEEKSNLNVSFGKGRKSGNGFVRCRPWYEAEVIVDKDITSQPGYPSLSSFKVITDDGWSFFCKTSGGNSKNFRSKDNLTTLGVWIKDKLVNAGLLKVGSKITEEILQKFGKDLKLIGTEDPNIWLLEQCDR